MGVGAFLYVVGSKGAGMRRETEVKDRRETEPRATPEKPLRARPAKGEVDFAELSRELLKRYPKIRAALAK